MRLSRLLLCGTILILWISSVCAQEGVTVNEALKEVTTLEIPASGFPVERTVAEAVQKDVTPGAAIKEVQGKTEIGPGTLRIQISRDQSESSAGWYRLRIAPDGTGELTASHTHLLYTAFCRVRDEWAGEDVNEFAEGRTVSVRLPWLEGNDGMFAGRPRFTRDYDPEGAIKELARLGCSHVIVNVLAFPAAYEQGPPGEIYHRFYWSSPDLDQFVATDLTRGLYPPEYLEANLNLLKKNVQLAVAYGLTPGIRICSPRSMPEAFFDKYPYLRGARVDHPYRSYRPRYTATLSHPVVRWHYAQMMKELMKEVPELGYLYLWTNDSGAGFEYTSTLYAGRNGGAYLIREWKTEKAIAEAAGKNVLRYFRLLRDAATETNPDFRLIAALSWFGAEQDIILGGLGEGLDLHIQPADTANEKTWPTIQGLEAKGSRLFASAQARGNFLLGVPSPWLTYERISAAVAPGTHEVSVTIDPPSLTPRNINREIVRAYQSGTPGTVDEIAESAARRWCGPDEAPTLVEAWRLTDQAVRSFPDVPLYGNSWAYPLYRTWVRPFVPNIEEIPERVRAYYEEHVISTFNNPTLIDFSADALWLLIDRDHAASIVRQSDSLVWGPLDKAIALLNSSLERQTVSTPAHGILLDQRDRLRALRSYFRNLRNIAGWIAGVHGYMAASSPDEKERMHSDLLAVIDDEMKNSEELLQLWNTTSSELFPISSMGENWSMYGDNFGELLQKKIELMKKHRNDTPFADPNFMWRMGPECPVEPAEYLQY
ncbi:MAG: hypothetical protein WBH56_17255 [Bacteroidota bacterium]